MKYMERSRMKMLPLFIFYVVCVLPGFGQDLHGQGVRVGSAAGKYIYVTAHRGDWRNTPENSLQAIRNAIAMGVDMAEIDLKRTKDGELIVLHDPTLNRTTTGKGDPADYTLQQIKELRLRNGYGMHTRHSIPTFREVMELAKGKILIDIDKGYDYLEEEMKVLRETGTSGQVIFNISADIPLDSVKRKYPQLTGSGLYIMPLISLDRPDAEATAASYLSYPKTIFQFIINKDTVAGAGLIAGCKRKGFAIWINAMWPELCGGHDDDRAVELGDPAGSWGWIVGRGADYIQTDRPQQLLHYLSGQKRHDQPGTKGLKAGR